VEFGRPVATIEAEGLRFVAGSDAGVMGTIPGRDIVKPVASALIGATAGNSSGCRPGLGLGPWSWEPAGLRRTSSPGRRLSVVVHSTPATRQPLHDGSCWSHRTFFNLPGVKKSQGKVGTWKGKCYQGTTTYLVPVAMAIKHWRPVLDLQ
jgi:hypothetical protein